MSVRFKSTMFSSVFPAAPLPPQLFNDVLLSDVSPSAPVAVLLAAGACADDDAAFVVAAAELVKLRLARSVVAPLCCGVNDELDGCAVAAVVVCAWDVDAALDAAWLPDELEAP